jgi:hypothetical protein
MKRKMRRIRPASWKLKVRRRCRPCARGHSLLSSVSLADRGETSEQLLLVLERVGEDHEQTSDDTEVSEEEREVEEQPVADTLDVSRRPALLSIQLTLRDDYAKETKDRVFRVSLGDHTEGAADHRLPSALPVDLVDHVQLTITLIKRKMWEIPQGKWRCLLGQSMAGKLYEQQLTSGGTIIDLPIGSRFAEHLP